MYTVSHDYYAILGVAKNAAPEEIKKQYRRLMKEHHSDQYDGLKAKYEQGGDKALLKLLEEKIKEAEEFCKLLNEAFDVLSDPVKRRQYDEQTVEPKIEEPNVSISPKTISFGTLKDGEKKSSVFIIKNDGGPAVSVNIDWEGTKPDWGDLVIEPDENSTFPIKVTVSVNTAGIPSGIKDDKILVTVDGKVQTVEIFLSVVKPVAIPTPILTTAPVAATSTLSAPVRGLSARAVAAALLVIMLGCGAIGIFGIGGAAISQQNQQNAQATATKQTQQAGETQSAMYIQQATQTVLDEFHNTVFVEEIELIGGQFPLKFRFVNNWNRTVYVSVNSWFSGDCAVEFKGELVSTFMDGKYLEPGEKSGFVYCRYQGDPKLFCEPTISADGERWQICPYKYK